jgi:hypothetical protein
VRLVGVPERSYRRGSTGSGMASRLGGHGRAPARERVEPLAVAQVDRWPARWDCTVVVDAKLGKLLHLPLGLAILSWAIIYRPLHDAPIEDAGGGACLVADGAGADAISCPLGGLQENSWPRTFGQ